MYKQELITSDILKRVFYIQYGNSSGTGFVVSLDGYDYMISARHIFEDTDKTKSLIRFHNTEIEIKYLKGDSWIALNGILLVHEDKTVDMAIIKLHKHDFDISLSIINCISPSYSVSQSCFLLGYPFGYLFSKDFTNINNGYPIPFVKKGIISAYSLNPSNLRQIFLDAHNNIGFSGGPVVTVENNKINVIGVISGFLNDMRVIDGIQNYIDQNSGITKVVPIDYMHEIIK